MEETAQTSPHAATIQNVAELILRRIATNPEGVQVANGMSEGKVQLRINVDPVDLGRIIGKQGRTINAVRTIVKAAGLKHQQQVALDLVTPDPNAAGAEPHPSEG